VQLVLHDGRDQRRGADGPGGAIWRYGDMVAGVNSGAPELALMSRQRAQTTEQQTANSKQPAPTTIMKSKQQAT